MRCSFWKGGVVVVVVVEYLGVGSLCRFFLGIVGGQLWRIDGWLVCVMMSELDSWNGMEWRRS